MSVSKQMMRTLAVCLAIGLMATVAVAQPAGGGPGGGRGGRGGRGFGGFGFGGPGRGGFGIDSLTLLMNEKVHEDLKLEPEQLASIQEISDASRDEQEKRRAEFGDIRDLPEDERRAAFEKMREAGEKSREETTKKINEVLNEDQQKRLDQISIQVRGTNALLDEKVQEKLGIEGDQKEKLDAAQEENGQAMRAAFEDMGPDADPEDRRAKVEELRKSAEEKLTAVLTDEQKTKFDEMKGEKIELTMQDFFRGRGGPGGGGFGPGGPGGPGGGGGRRGGGRGGDRGDN